MTKRGLFSSPVLRGQGSSGSLDRRSAAHPNEVTDIIPFDEFDIDDLDHDSGFDSLDSDLADVPEWDDLADLAGLAPLQPVRGRRRRSTGPSSVPVRRAKHRKQPTSAARSRVMIAAMAAGAAAAAAHAASQSTGAAPERAVLVAAKSPLGAESGGTDAPAGPAGPASHGMQMITVKPAANSIVHNEELAKGVAFAQERAEREARLQRPLFVMPTRGMFTSSFGYRWGVLHGGIDIANSIGTPILAASDGVVIEVGPSAGYGMLVKLRHSDGTVTMYGHVNTTTVSYGERVMAGDQIATMGNRGFSTGSHLHFEVLLGGTTRVDPVSWLGSRGVSVGA